jgi:cytochrome P450
VRIAFTPRVVERLRSRVDAIVNDLVTQVEPNGSMDVIKDVAEPLPLMVISELLGVPRADASQFVVWASDIASFQATGSAQLDNALRASRAVENIEQYFSRVCEERRAALGDDLISLMVSARDAEDQLTNDELINMCANFLLAGHETTRSLIGNGLLTLLTHPAQLDKLRANPQLITEAIEECLRFESPVQRGWRRVASDITVAGQDIKAGQLVFLMLGAANRDPQHFNEPDEFDVQREDNRHLAFGYGIHFCIGAPLARLEAPIALWTLINRFPKLRLNGDVRWNQNIHARGLQSLGVSW